MRIVSVDVRGLNLILGGGIPVLKRHETFEESATLLVRGPSGSGKTVLGTQLASSLARSLHADSSRRVDVAYACVELLPSELSAQRAGLRPENMKERVISSPFHLEESTSDECRIYAGILDLGSPVDEQARLVPAIGALLAAIQAAGGTPRVLVVDSLSDGYHLGGSAPRPLADDLCKMAAKQGMVLVLLEETSNDAPSEWSFVTDIVIELGRSNEEASNDSDAFERVLRVVKNRFGPAEPGTHRFAIFPKTGVIALPRPRTYLAQWALEVVFPILPDAPRQKQGFYGVGSGVGTADFRACVTAIYGPDESDVLSLARTLGTTTEAGQEPIDGSDIVLNFNRFLPGGPHHTTSPEGTIDCGDPFVGGDWLLLRALDEVNRLICDKKAVRRVLVGDLQSIRAFSNPEGIRRAITVLVSLLRHAHVPALLFETSHEPSPLCVDVADVIVSLDRGSQVSKARVRVRT
jgi:KaiC/GvpD/RAD55 family RecA-like ATPase